MPKVAGSCLCGAVRYESQVEPLMTAICHCDNCQRQSGSAFSIIVGVPAGSLRFDNEAGLATYEDRGTSGKAVHRRFCKSCGSPVLSLVDMMPDVHFIKAGTLHDRSWLKPTAHFWCDTAQPWVEIPAGVTKAPRNPQ